MAAVVMKAIFELQWSPGVESGESGVQLPISNVRIL